MGKYYDPDTKEFFGRNAKSWQKILSFYFIYFIFLTILFIISIALGKTGANTSGPAPKLVGRGIQTPGLSFEPRLKMDGGSIHRKRLKARADSLSAFEYKSGDNDTDSDTNWVIYKDAMNLFIKTARTKDPRNEAAFGPCGDENFGFDIDKPCLFFKLNRVIDWEPAGMYPAEIDDFYRSTQPFCLVHQHACKMEKYDTSQITTDNVGDTVIHCIETEAIVADESARIIRSGTPSAEKVKMTYYPTNGKLDFVSAFKGMSDTSYKSSMVAVQFDLSAAKDTSFHVQCFAFDRNIEIFDHELGKSHSGSIKIGMHIKP